ncbi:hypothetical protein [Maricaulis maris]|uniref:hypothetical protein n=1 Tax=Maricaulis maris TaxID=74318 RepID=UPI003B8E9ABC
MTAPFSIESALGALQKAPAVILLAVTSGLGTLIYLDLRPDVAWLDLGLLMPVVVVFCVLAGAIGIGKIGAEGVAAYQRHSAETKYEKKRVNEFKSLRAALLSLDRPAIEILFECYNQRSTTIRRPQSDAGVVQLHQRGYVRFFEEDYDREHRGRVGVYFLADQIAEHIRERDFFGAALGRAKQ